MIKLLGLLTLVFLLPSFTGSPFFAEKETEIIIIGSPHREISKFKKEDFFEAIKNARPDLLLIELDSGMLTKDFSIPTSLLSVYEFGLADQYLKQNPVVLLRPFDIEGRNEFFMRNRFFEEEGRFYSKLDELYKKDSLTAKNKSIYETSLQLNASTNAISESEGAILNSVKTDEAVAKKMNWYYGHFGELISSTPSLTKFQEHFSLDSVFWIRRNQAMVDHIVSYAILFKGKRIVVVTGYYHRYILKELLKKIEKQNSFKIREYYSR